MILRQMRILIGVVLSMLLVSAYAQTNVVDSNDWKQGLWLGTNPNGNRFEVYYRNDTLNGAYKEYGKKGELIGTRIYVNGQLNGETKDWWREGVLREEGNYKNGKRDGLTKVYHSDGELFKVIDFKNGLMSKWRYYKKDRLMAEANFIDEVLNGDFTLYDDKGNVVGKSRYQMGKLISADSTFNEQGKLIELRIPNSDGTRFVEIRSYKPDGTVKKVKKVDLPLPSWSW